MANSFYNKLLTTADEEFLHQAPPVHLEVSGDPVHLKRRVLPYGLREPVRQQLKKMLEDGIISEVESSAWGTPIVTPLKPDGKTPRICGDYRLTLNSTKLYD